MMLFISILLIKINIIIYYIRKKVNNKMSAKTEEKKHNDEENENLIIVEEKIHNGTSESGVRKYIKGKYLGKGGFAKCYEFQNMDTKKIVAAKIIAKSALMKSRAKQKLMSEIRIHRSLHHKSIVGFEHFFEDSENVYILLEMCRSQTLNELLRRRKRLVDLEVQCYVLQMIEGLKYLHNHRVIHRDLKLGNLFLTDKMELKIADFGLATKLEFETEKKKTICGTPNYIAPEIISGRDGHSYEVDIWSLGVIIYTMLVGKPPFETSDVNTTYKRIKMNAYSFPAHIPVCEEAKKLVGRILNLNPAKRPTLDQILDDPYFRLFHSVPALMPTYTLACPPSSTFLNNFSQSDPGVCERLEKTTPLTTSKEPRANPLLNTDRGLSLKRDASRRDLGKGSRVVCVKKYIDYSNKYGVGYILNNGAVGVFYNDSTKLIALRDDGYFTYVKRSSKESPDNITRYEINKYPKELQKKVTIYHNFKAQLESDENKAESGCGRELVYVKKWMRTNSAILFRLSNKVVQMCFKDNTEIVLDSVRREVIYVNKKAERLSFPLSSASEAANPEMAKRLRYTKEVLTRMLTGSFHKDHAATERASRASVALGPKTHI